MLLTLEKSKCEKEQAIVVSKDKGTRREHRATNPQTDRRWCISEEFI